MARIHMATGSYSSDIATVDTGDGTCDSKGVQKNNMRVSDVLTCEVKYQNAQLNSLHALTAGPRKLHRVSCSTLHVPWPTAEERDT